MHHEVLYLYSEILTITQMITSCSFSVMNVDFISEITGLGVSFTVHLTQTDKSYTATITGCFNLGVVMSVS